jgi:hypothetical protein
VSYTLDPNCPGLEFPKTLRLLLPRKLHNGGTKIASFCLAAGCPKRAFFISFLCVHNAQAAHRSLARSFGRSVNRGALSCIHSPFLYRYSRRLAISPAFCVENCYSAPLPPPAFVHSTIICKTIYKLLVSSPRGAVHAPSLIDGQHPPTAPPTIQFIIIVVIEYARQRQQRSTTQTNAHRAPNTTTHDDDDIHALLHYTTCASPQPPPHHPHPISGCHPPRRLAPRAQAPPPPRPPPPPHSSRPKAPHPQPPSTRPSPSPLPPPRRSRPRRRGARGP